MAKSKQRQYYLDSGGDYIDKSSKRSKWWRKKLGLSRRSAQSNNTLIHYDDDHGDAHDTLDRRGRKTKDAEYLSPSDQWRKNSDKAVAEWMQRNSRQQYYRPAQSATDDTTTTMTTSGTMETSTGGSTTETSTVTETSLTSGTSDIRTQTTSLDSDLVLMTPDLTSGTNDTFFTSNTSMDTSALTSQDTTVSKPTTDFSSSLLGTSSLTTGLSTTTTGNLTGDTGTTDYTTTGPSGSTYTTGDTSTLVGDYSDSFTTGTGYTYGTTGLSSYMSGSTANTYDMTGLSSNLSGLMGNTSATTGTTGYMSGTGHYGISSQSATSLSSAKTTSGSEGTSGTTASGSTTAASDSTSATSGLSDSTSAINSSSAVTSASGVLSSASVSDASSDESDSESGTNASTVGSTTTATSYTTDGTTTASETSKTSQSTTGASSAPSRSYFEMNSQKFMSLDGQSPYATPSSSIDWEGRTPPSEDHTVSTRSRAEYMSTMAPTPPGWDACSTCVTSTDPSSMTSNQSDSLFLTDTSYDDSAQTETLSETTTMSPSSLESSMRARNINMSHRTATGDSTEGYSSGSNFKAQPSSDEFTSFKDTRASEEKYYTPKIIHHKPTLNSTNVSNAGDKSCCSTNRNDDQLRRKLREGVGNEELQVPAARSSWWKRHMTMKNLRRKYKKKKSSKDVEPPPHTEGCEDLVEAQPRKPLEAGGAGKQTRKKWWGRAGVSQSDTLTSLLWQRFRNIRNKRRKKKVSSKGSQKVHKTQKFRPKPRYARSELDPDQEFEVHNVESEHMFSAQSHYHDKDNLLGKGTQSLGNVRRQGKKKHKPLHKSLSNVHYGDNAKAKPQVINDRRNINQNKTLSFTKYSKVSVSDTSQSHKKNKKKLSKHHRNMSRKDEEVNNQSKPSIKSKSKTSLIMTPRKSKTRMKPRLTKPSFTRVEKSQKERGSSKAEINKRIMGSNSKQLAKASKTETSLASPSLTSAPSDTIVSESQLTSAPGSESSDDESETDESTTDATQVSGSNTEESESEEEASTESDAETAVSTASASNVTNGGGKSLLKANESETSTKKRVNSTADSESEEEDDDEEDNEEDEEEEDTSEASESQTTVSSEASSSSSAAESESATSAVSKDQAASTVAGTAVQSGATTASEATSQTSFTTDYTYDTMTTATTYEPPQASRAVRPHLQSKKSRLLSDIAEEHSEDAATKRSMPTTCSVIYDSTATSRESSKMTSSACSKEASTETSYTSLYDDEFITREVTSDDNSHKIINKSSTRSRSRDQRRRRRHHPYMTAAEAGNVSADGQLSSDMRDVSQDVQEYIDMLRTKYENDKKGTGDHHGSPKLFSKLMRYMFGCFMKPNPTKHLKSKYAYSAGGIYY